eukprot:TRINITY_DN19527_c0_g1_i2.p1 TRINITY_DN19527_c0_g1~~TRINITY_DN19527_c0_g1_i2.p1  ORF type:complete len:172 (+),score=17.93 TRINITY_DN19527_c0_g1_i2:101-616(+)
MQSPSRWKKIINEVVAAIAINEIAPDNIVRVRRSPRALGYFACEECDLVFGSYTALCVHCTRVHGYRDETSRFARADGVCQICLRVFHTRHRLRLHLKHGAKKRGPDSCFAGYIRVGIAQLNEEEIELLDQADRDEMAKCRRTGERFGVAKMPWVQAYGPLLPTECEEAFF